MNSAMLVTVGVGNTVSDAIAFAIRGIRPDFVVFLTTEQSEKQTMSAVVEKLALSPENYTYRRVADEDDVENCTLIFIAAIQDLKTRGFDVKDIVADFTTGTKAMSAALVAAGIGEPIGKLSYIIGERGKGGIVISGTERALSLEPNRLTIRRMTEQAIAQFNATRFDTCLEMLDQIVGFTRLPQVTQAMATLQTLAKGYRAWDQFDYKSAMPHLNCLKGNELLPKWGLKSKLEQHKAFLHRVSKSEYGVERALDLWNSAEKRKAEGRFDDAIARLYRLMEYIAQVQLFNNHKGLKTSDLDVQLLPEPLRPQYIKKVGRSDKITLPLYESYELLKHLGDGLGCLFADEYDGTVELKKVLGLRNQSILAHGFGPVSQKGCETARDYVRKFMAQAFPDWAEKAKEAVFPALNPAPVIESLGLAGQSG